MPRTENDTRTPYAKATARRVQRGLRLVEQMKAELFSIEQALGSGRYLYTTSIGGMAVRLGSTMAELEALEEMHDDAEAVAVIENGPPFSTGDVVEWDSGNAVYPTTVLRLVADSDLIGDEVRLQGRVTDPETGSSAQASIIRRVPQGKVRKISVPDLEKS